jgi:hypothetical protein
VQANHASRRPSPMLDPTNSSELGGEGTPSGAEYHASANAMTVSSCPPPDLQRTLLVERNQKHRAAGARWDRPSQ